LDEAMTLVIQEFDLHQFAPFAAAAGLALIAATNRDKTAFGTRHGAT
jgi:hypothetical protein